MEKKEFNEKEKRAYKAYAKAHAPSSTLFADCIWSFAVGGFICVIGQLIGDGFRMNGLDEQAVGSLVSVSLIALSCLLTGLGVYEKIAGRAKAGTLVPITGFANAVCACAVDGKTEGFVLGVGTQMFAIAGPVIVYGSIASVIYGIIYYLQTLA